jgi:hypothetical protein
MNRGISVDRSTVLLGLVFPGIVSFALPSPMTLSAWPLIEFESDKVPAVRDFSSLFNATFRSKMGHPIASTGSGLYFSIVCPAQVDHYHTLDGGLIIGNINHV